MLPITAVIYGGFNAEPEVWQHLVDYVLPTAIPNTLWLVAGVTTLAILIGTLLAWLTTAYAFAGRRLFVILLLLPLAMPSYILAFIYLDWISYPAPLPTWWRAQGWGEFPLQPGRALTIVTMTFGLYPYVFLVTRQAFLSQGQKLIEAAAMLGSSKWRIARRVVIPLSLPWIAGSGLLVAMETLADYGTVAIFNY
ncbi:MAG: ABC transporter permease subunit, partial [Moraxellaceae bacterium]|nr:ABC transporter permease subunit [Moraxellaceae bacterium]